MLTRLQKWAPLLCVLLFCQSCKTDKTDAPVLDNSVEKEYELDLWETLANSTRTFQLRVSTIKNQQCLNYYLQSSGVRSGNNIDINLGKPQSPSVCVSGSGPARADLELGLLPVGVYNFTVKLDKIVPSTGRLIVSPSSFFLSTPNSIGFRVVNNTILRVPDKTIWGYIGYELSALSVVDQFLQDLAKISQENSLAKGYYGYFSLLDNGTIEYGNAQPSTDRPIKSILRNFEGNEKDLENLIKTYREKYGKTVSIHLRNTEGKQY